MKTVIKESTRFFTDSQKAWAFAQAIGAKKDHTVIDYGKTDDYFWIKYRKEADNERSV